MKNNKRKNIISHGGLVLLIIYLVCVSVIITTGTLSTLSRYSFTLENQSFTIETAEFDLNHTARDMTAVYKEDSEFFFSLENTSSQTGEVSAKDIRFFISVHNGNDLYAPDLTTANEHFKAFLNAEELGIDDKSRNFTLAGSVLSRADFSLSLEWDSPEDFGVLRFVYIKISVLQPYVQDYVFRLTLIGKSLLELGSEGKTDVFGNNLQSLSITGAPAFGASLPFSY